MAQGDRLALPLVARDANRSGLLAVARAAPALGDAPPLKPGDIQEAKEWTRRAFELFEAYDLSVVVNAPFQLCYNIGGLELGREAAGGG